MNATTQSETGNATNSSTLETNNKSHSYNYDYYNNYTEHSHTDNYSSIFSRYTWTEFLEVHGQMALCIDRVVTPIWYVIGITGNLFSAVIWFQRRMRTNNSSAVYLAALSISDLAFLLLHPLQELQYAWSVPVLQLPVLCEIYFLFYLFSQYLSPTLVLGFTAERYIAVCHPFRKKSLCRTGRAVKVVVATVITCFLFSSVQAYFWTYDSQTRECQVRADVISHGHPSLWSVWTWTSEMVIFLAVPMTILTLNLLVIRELHTLSRKERKASDLSGSGCAATTAMLLSVSFYVIVTSLPATVVYVLETTFPLGELTISDAAIRRDPIWKRYFVYLTTRKIVEEFCLSHYACNFFLFLITGQQFRQSFVFMFHRPTVTKDTEQYVEVATTLSPNRNHSSAI